MPVANCLLSIATKVRIEASNVLQAANGKKKINSSMLQAKRQMAVATRNLTTSVAFSFTALAANQSIAAKNISPIELAQP